LHKCALRYLGILAWHGVALSSGHDFAIVHPYRRFMI
jgi:hypothetical protein